MNTILKAHTHISFQIAIISTSDKYLVLSCLCKYHLKAPLQKMFSLSDDISIENFPSLHIIITSGSDKYLLFSPMFKYDFIVSFTKRCFCWAMQIQQKMLYLLKLQSPEAAASICLFKYHFIVSCTKICFSWAMQFQ